MVSRHTLFNVNASRGGLSGCWDARFEVDGTASGPVNRLDCGVERRGVRTIKFKPMGLQVCSVARECGVRDIITPVQGGIAVRGLASLELELGIPRSGAKI
jgi:hypothetical protein